MFTLFLSLTILLLPSYSILTEERLERLTKGIAALELEAPVDYSKEDDLEEKTDHLSTQHKAGEDILNGSAKISLSSSRDSIPGRVSDDGNQLQQNIIEGNFYLANKDLNDNTVVQVDPESQNPTAKTDGEIPMPEACDICSDDLMTNKKTVERRLPSAVLPLLRHQYESSESSSRYITESSDVIKPKFS